MAPALSKHPMAESPLIEDLGVKTRMIQDNRVYAAMMKSYDDSLAKIRRVLAATDDPRHPGKKLSETTIIVVSSDHGGKSTTPIADKKRLENDITDPVNPGRNKNYLQCLPHLELPLSAGQDLGTRRWPQDSADRPCSRTDTRCYRVRCLCPRCRLLCLFCRYGRRAATAR